jgi:hypothetical protein
VRDTIREPRVESDPPRIVPSRRVFFSDKCMMERLCMWHWPHWPQCACCCMLLHAACTVAAMYHAGRKMRQRTMCGSSWRRAGAGFPRNGRAEGYGLARPVRLVPLIPERASRGQVSRCVRLRAPRRPTVAKDDGFQRHGRCRLGIRIGRRCSSESVRRRCTVASVSETAGAR